MQITSWKYQIGVQGDYETLGKGGSKRRTVEVVAHCPASLSVATLGLKLKRGIPDVCKSDRYIVKTPKLSRSGRPSGEFEFMAPLRGAFEKVFYLGGEP